ncbi:MAG: TolC family protein [Bacteroidaceae bacterium]|nr:TolC family protein [Bacteroidaceae bacterium]MBQ8710307.1 TolC family protein [Bacteroidaceae bacterium]
MKRLGRMRWFWLGLICLFPMLGHAENDTLRMSLDECILLARRQSVDAAVALGELKSAYWEWRSHKANLLPEVSLSANVPTYNKRYSTYQKEDGTHSYVRNDYMELDGSIYVSQKIWPTGGTLSVESSLDWMRQMSGDTSGGRNQFMSMPIALTLSQPLFGVNTVKWDRRIEPIRYKEAKASFLTETEQVAMQAISLYFNLLLANENVNIAEQNLQNAEKLYEVAQAKREMGSISQNDVLQMRLGILNAQSALTSAESHRKAQMFELKAYLDVESDIEPIVPEEIPEVTLLYEEVLEKALANNAFANRMRRRQLEADYSVAYAKGNMRSVTLYAQVGYTGTDRTFGDAYRNLSSKQVVQVGVSLPLLDWGKRRGQVKVAESNREIVRNQVRQQSQEFRQNLFVLTEQFNHQRQQLRIAEEADTIAQRRYHTNVETFKIGSISTLELSDAQTAKDEARQRRISELFNYWYYYYQLRSITLWDFEKGQNINVDFEKIVK